MRMREMRAILKLIDDMPREEQLRCVEKLDEMWRDYYDIRFDCIGWWEESKRKYRAYLALTGGRRGIGVSTWNEKSRLERRLVSQYSDKRAIVSTRHVFVSSAGSADPPSSVLLYGSIFKKKVSPAKSKLP